MNPVTKIFIHLLQYIVNNPVEFVKKFCTILSSTKKHFFAGVLTGILCVMGHQLHYLTNEVKMLKRKDLRVSLQHSVKWGLRSVFSEHLYRERYKNVVFGIFYHERNGTFLEPAYCQNEKYGISNCQVDLDNLLEYNAVQFGASTEYAKPESFSYTHPPYKSNENYICRKFQNQQLMRIFNRKYGLICDIYGLFNVYILDKQEMTQDEFNILYDSVFKSIMLSVPEARAVVSNR